MKRKLLSSASIGEICVQIRLNTVRSSNNIQKQASRLINKRERPIAVVDYRKQLISIGRITFPLLDISARNELAAIHVKRFLRLYITDYIVTVVIFKAKQLSKRSVAVVKLDICPVGA